MKMNRIMLAAPKSGSGKTTITCAVLQLLKDRRVPVSSYKCGPDYIDPMFHQKVLGVPAKNLDTFFTDEETTRKLFLADRKEGDFAVLEGVMGLYDGLGGIREEGSSYHLAKVTRTPIILVVDAKGMGRSVVALIAGFLQCDTDHLIRGVLLNRMSKGYYEIIKPLIERELSLKVVGYFPDQREMHLESRHLGLVLPDELADIRKQLRETADCLAETIDLDALTEIAAHAEELDGEETAIAQHPICCTIAVARDDAFCFYYEDNLRLLRQYGAELTYFSPLHDENLPDCDGVLFGGGYPELYAKELSTNTSMRDAIRTAFRRGMPMVAECGGFMYLHSLLYPKMEAGSVAEGCAMVGVLDAECRYAGKLVRFGYIELEEVRGNFLPPYEKIKAHEFHYFDSSENGRACIATKPATGKKYSCIVSGEHYWLGFPHLYYPSNPHFAESFVRKASKYKIV